MQFYDDPNVVDKSFTQVLFRAAGYSG